MRETKESDIVKTQEVNRQWETLKNGL